MGRFGRANHLLQRKLATVGFFARLLGNGRVPQHNGFGSGNFLKRSLRSRHNPRRTNRSLSMGELNGLGSWNRIFFPCFACQVFRKLLFVIGLRTHKQHHDNDARKTNKVNELETRPKQRDCENSSRYRFDRSNHRCLHRADIGNGLHIDPRGDDRANHDNRSHAQNHFSIHVDGNRPGLLDKAHGNARHEHREAHGDQAAIAADKLNGDDVVCSKAHGRKQAPHKAGQRHSQTRNVAIRCNEHDADKRENEAEHLTFSW